MEIKEEKFIFAANNMSERTSRIFTIIMIFSIIIFLFSFFLYEFRRQEFLKLILVVPESKEKQILPENKEEATTITDKKEEIQNNKEYLGVEGVDDVKQEVTVKEMGKQEANKINDKDSDADGLSDNQEVNLGDNPFKNEKAEAEKIDLSKCDNEGEITSCDGGIGFGSISLVDACIGDEASRLNNLYICDRISESHSMKWACYSAIAQKRKNVNVCDFIENKSYHKVICYSKIAELTNDRKICDKILAVEHDEKRIKMDYEDCHLNYVLRNIRNNKSDYSLCDSLPTAEKKAACYRILGGEFKNIELCKKSRVLNQAKESENLDAKEESEDNDCFIYNAIFKRDENICDYVIPEKWRSPEYENFPHNYCIETVSGLNNRIIGCTDLGHPYSKYCVEK